ncbi:MAG: hypothetical protein KDH96_08185 [Candidatus Riesia sp.]|nr:hypothetical protein [Candidatus Riesia sp.]
MYIYLIFFAAVNSYALTYPNLTGDIQTQNNTLIFKCHSDLNTTGKLHMLIASKHRNDIGMFYKYSKIISGKGTVIYVDHFNNHSISSEIDLFCMQDGTINRFVLLSIHNTKPIVEKSTKNYNLNYTTMIFTVLIILFVSGTAFLVCILKRRQRMARYDI